MNEIELVAQNDRLRERLREQRAQADTRITELQAENAELRKAVVALRHLWPLERWATLSAICRDYPCIDEAARAAGG